ncbi:MAG: RCC1 domain-containing protein, partial [Solirubrobacteraceae bacterium]
MRVSQTLCTTRQRRRHAAATAVLVVLGAIAVALPAGAPAGQSSQATPAPVAQVVAGLYHSCALLDDGTTPAPPGRPVRCWGFSGDGQVGYANTNWIGDDETPGSAGPVALGAGRTAKALAAGDYHSCAVLDDGNVRCWGYGNEGQLGYGSRDQIGDNEPPSSIGPVGLGAGRTATAITAGGNHTCAILDDGNVRCWGLGEFGQLGYGPGPNGATPPSIGDSENPGEAGPVNLGAHTATAITAGAFHTCAILDDASVRCWGLGSNGQLGYGATSAVLDPSTVGSVNLGVGRTATAISAGFAHTCAVLDDGNVRCWGLNEFGQLGYGNKTSIGDTETPAAAGPVDLGPERTATAISAGGEHTCAVLDDGNVRCWGSPLDGQLGYANLLAVGDDESPASIAPVDLGPGRKATAVAAGIYHTCARIDDGSVRCWGNGDQGRLGLCNRATVGDDETPGSVGRIDLGAGGAACSRTGTKPPGGPPVAPPTPPATSVEQLALRTEKARAKEMRACRADVTRQARKARSRARQRYRHNPRRRALALG